MMGRDEAGSVVCPCGAAAAPTPKFELPGFRVLRCAACGTDQLVPLGLAVLSEGLDRDRFEGAFHGLRTANYRKILAVVGTLVGQRGRRLLDVGCSSGWFLQEASAAGWQAHGVEPDPYYGQQAVRRLAGNAAIIEGFFPESLPADWQDFDVISFHDVFEHLTHPEEILGAVRKRLAPGGLLVLSLPMRTGFAFGVAAFLYRLGSRQGLERVFQVHYPFPHVFYYTLPGIRRLGERAGFQPVHEARLRSFSLRGSFDRARMDHAAGLRGAVRQWLNGLGLALVALAEPLLPTDGALVILRRGED